MAAAVTESGSDEKRPFKIPTAGEGKLRFAFGGSWWGATSAGCWACGREKETLIGRGTFHSAQKNVRPAILRGKRLRCGRRRFGVEEGELLSR